MSLPDGRLGTMMDITSKKILVTGSHGFLGGYVVEGLLKRGVPKENLSLPHIEDANFVKWEDCKKAVEGQDIVLHLAAKVGGIGFNQKFPGELFYDNLMMGCQLIEAARQANIEKFVSIGTTCSYPKFTPIPFKEEDIWNGYPEETNAPYGLAKKMLLVQADAYRAQYGFNAITLFPVNMYGPRDTFSEDRSHVISALIRKVSEAKAAKQPYIEVWGTGEATREFIYAEDAAEGTIKALEQFDKPGAVNIGSGMEISIKDLTALICKLMNYEGEMRWDATKPNGQPRRRVDITRAKQEFGFEAKTDFETGLKQTIEWYENSVHRT